MQNEVDGRRDEYDDQDEHDPRYQDHVPQYEDHESPQPEYVEEPAYQENYQAYDDQNVYEPYPPKRSRIIPILTVVAGLLALALGVIVVLYAIGFFEGGTNPGTQVASEEATPIDLTPDTLPEVPEVREIDTAKPLAALPEQTAEPATTNIRDAAVAVLPSEQNDPPVRSTHGDWQIRCDTPAGAQSEQCVLMQFVLAEDRDNVGLNVLVLKTADGEAKIMRIITPLGVLLPSGLSLRIDDTDIGRAGFVRCLPTGCVAEVFLEEPLLETLGSGDTATFIIFLSPEEGIGIPIPLTGFGEGFAALPTPSPAPQP
ncbi:MAG: invasion associated locus B family protein [Hyphomicrobiales bacterium]|nr:invasion associated locus B family protein [Hyphomicrobiales bacterium]